MSKNLVGVLSLFLSKHTTLSKSAACLLPIAYCLLLLLSYQTSAQVFPIQGNVSLTPPYNPYLSSLTAPGAQRLQLNLRVSDPSLSDYVCKLRVTIDGVGITLRTRSTYVPQPITLPGGGIPQTFYGEDIADYFNPANLDFAGITRRDFEKTNRLPEGVYRFTIEVLDYNRGTVVSNRFFATAWIILNDPPLLNLPRNATKVSILDPTNIAFTWTPRHTASVNAAFTTEYVFKLVELAPTSPQPLSRGEGLGASGAQLAAANQALLSQPALFEITTDQSSLVYGPGEPALLPGRLYAWQVQARDIEGADLFKNLGKSEVFVFQFGDALGVPQNVRKESGNATSITLRWDVPDQGDMPEHYRIQYKPTFSDTWYDVRTQPGQRWHNVYDLIPGTAYQLRVRAEKGKNTGEYSAPVTIPTEDASSQFQCGNPSVIPTLTPAEPLFKLLPGDRIIASRFPILITEVDGSDGVFEGKGWLKVPAFNGIGVKVKFNGKVDVAYQLDGSWESTSSPNSRMTTLIEEMEKIGEARLKILLEESDSALNAVPPAVVPLIIAGEIESVTVNAQGEIVITKEDGTQETITQPTNQQGEKQTTVITDSAGNQYVVESKDGKTTVTKVEGGGLGAGESNLQEVVAGSKIDPSYFITIPNDTTKYRHNNAFTFIRQNNKVLLQLNGHVDSLKTKLIWNVNGKEACKGKAVCEIDLSNKGNNKIKVLLDKLLLIEVAVNVYKNPLVTFERDGGYTGQYGFDDAQQSELQKAGDYTKMKLNGADYYVPVLTLTDRQRIDVRVKLTDLVKDASKDKQFEITLKPSTAEITINNLSELKLNYTQINALSTITIASSAQAAASYTTPAYIEALDQKNNVVGKLYVICNTLPVQDIVLVYVNIGNGYSSTPAPDFVNFFNTRSHNQFFKNWHLFKYDTMDISKDYKARASKYTSRDSVLTNLVKYYRKNNLAGSALDPSKKYLFVTDILVYNSAGQQVGGLAPIGGFYSAIFKGGALEEAAHEVGHNLRLQHTFDPSLGARTIPQGKTKNFMDYIPSGRNMFFFYQWQIAR